MPIGRGGSGNYWEAQREQAAASEDVEAQLAKQRDQILEVQANASAPADYAFRARGGAGNVYSPKELAATGNFESKVVEPTSQSAFTSSDPASSTPIRMSGRGGAGNFVYATTQVGQEVRGVRDEQKEKAQQIQASVAQNVEHQLKPPAKARVPDERVG